MASVSGRTGALRIALYHNHPAGGAARAISEVAEVLHGRHHVDVFTLSSAEEPSTRAARPARCFQFEPHSPVRFGVYLNELLAFRDIGLLHRVNRDAATQIDDGGYDVVLVSACRFAQAPPVLAYLATPHVYFCHEPPRRFIDSVCRPETVNKGTYERFHQFVHAPAHRIVESAWQRADRRAVLSATALLTNSRFTQGRIRDYYGLDATVTYLGVDCARFTEASRDGDFVLSVGAVENHKGYDFLIRALSRLPKGRRPRLMLVGASANQSVLKGLTALASALGVELTVRLRLSDAHLAEMYRRARAFVYSPHLEPFGLVVLEAMASALPVVAVAEGGIPEAIENDETGILVKRDEAAFADALECVLTDANRAMKLGTAARQRAHEAWTWEAAAARVEVELERVRRRQPAEAEAVVSGRRNGGF